MKRISLTSNGKLCTLFHIMKEKKELAQVQPDALNDKNKMCKVTKRFFRITGYHHRKDPLALGDGFLYGNQFYEIVKINEIRDHNGVFEDPEDAKDGYYDCDCVTTVMVPILTPTPTSTKK